MILDGLYRAARPVVFQLDAESVHERVLAQLATVSRHDVLLRVLQALGPKPDPRFAMRAFGLTFPFPLGIAAGFDKNAAAFPALLAFGFGHVEIGTMTPRPQSGNPHPRVFRLPADRALINRMGFPGSGVAAAVSSMAQLKRPDMLVGCNIGPNKASVVAGMAVNDLVAGYRAVAASASYVAINISSPNTPELRALQGKNALRELLAAVNQERTTLLRCPLLLKISPDLNRRELVDLIEVALESGVDGLIATNTTVSRPASLRSASKHEAGGLSGSPLASLTAGIVRTIARETGGTLSVIAVGGIETGADIVAAIRAGAVTTQTYTGLIYRGPAMTRTVAIELDAELRRLGASTLKELRGTAI